MVITECKLPPKNGFVEEELSDGTRVYAEIKEYCRASGIACDIIMAINQI